MTNFTVELENLWSLSVESILSAIKNYQAKFPNISVNYLSNEASTVSSPWMVLRFLNIFGVQQPQRLTPALLLELSFTIATIVSYRKYIHSS